LISGDFFYISENNQGFDFGYKPLIFKDLRFRQAMAQIEQGQKVATDA